MSAMGATHSHYRDNIGDVDSIIGITPEAMKGVKEVELPVEVGTVGG